MFSAENGKRYAFYSVARDQTNNVEGVPTGPDTSTRVAVTCFGKLATIVGTSRNDVLIGTPGRDVIAGLGGKDVIKGGGGNDLLCGGSGSDKLRGGKGRDKLDGGAGKDACNGGAGLDTAVKCEHTAGLP